MAKKLSTKKKRALRALETKPTKSNSMEIKNTRGAGIDYREILSQFITQGVLGPNGYGKAIREIICNASDAGADSMLIYYDYVKGVLKRIYLNDNAKGFGQEGISSALSLGMSSRDRNDLTTSGTNGTGMKDLLGLGDINKTKVSVETIFDLEAKSMSTFDFDLEYLVGLSEQIRDPDDQVIQVPLPKSSIWSKEVMPRTTGSNVILHNPSVDKVYSPAKLITSLAKFLSPKLAKKVKVYNPKSVEWVGLKPKKFGGKHIVQTYRGSKIGSVSFSLFLEPEYNSGDIVMCGAENPIQDLATFIKRNFPQYSGELEVLFRCGGYIYAPKLNMYRLSYGVFKDTFHSSGDAAEYVSKLRQMAAIVRKELDKKEKSPDEDLQKKMFSSVMKINQTVYGKRISSKVKGLDGKVTSARKRNKSLINLHPTTIILEPGEIFEQEMRDYGPLDYDVSQYNWDDTNAHINVTQDPGMGHKVLLQAGNKIAKGYFRLTHPSDDIPDQKILTEVTDHPRKHIDAPGKLHAGSVYEIKVNGIKGEVDLVVRFSKPSDRKYGRFEKIDRFTFRLYMHDEVPENPSKTLLVEAAHVSGHVFIDKRIPYFPRLEGNGKQLYSFGKYLFELSDTPSGVNKPLAHLGVQFGDIPKISMNMDAPKFAKASFEDKSHMMYASIAAAALSYLVDKGYKGQEIDRDELLELNDEFILKSRKATNRELNLLGLPKPYKYFAGLLKNRNGTEKNRKN